ncbi:hypothetical protein OROMI_004069 [Orobanche minor]
MPFVQALLLAGGRCYEYRLPLSMVIAVAAASVATMG